MASENESQVREVAVVGAGAVGYGIAQLCAQHGYLVTIYEIDEEARRQALVGIRAKFDESVEVGTLTPEEGHKALGRIFFMPTLQETVALAELVVEAVAESLELKLEVLAEVSAEARSDAIIATTTSSLSLLRLAEAVAEPGRFLGLRFPDSVHGTEPVEVVLVPQTTDAAREAVRALLGDLCKEPIVVQDSLGSEKA